MLSICRNAAAYQEGGPCPLCSLASFLPGGASEGLLLARQALAGEAGNPEAVQRRSNCQPGRVRLLSGHASFLRSGGLAEGLLLRRGVLWRQAVPIQELDWAANAERRWVEGLAGNGEAQS